MDSTGDTIRASQGRRASVLHHSSNVRGRRRGDLAPGREPVMTSPAAAPARYRLTPMRPRDPHEPGRAASSLELFFDLVFVVAVSIAAVQLHHALTEAHVAEGALSYAMVFFAIWWAWMNFTWFATSFATDDWLYRVLTIVQMAGVLVLAAGIEAAFVEHDFTVVILATS